MPDRVIFAPPHWPQGVNEEMAYNRDFPEGIDDLAALGAALRHLCGAMQHIPASVQPDAQSSRAIAAGDTHTWKVHLLPYARDVEVWLLWSSSSSVLSASEVYTVNVSCDAAGSGTFTRRLRISDAAWSVGDVQWTSGVITDAGDGTASAEGEIEIEIENDATSPYALVLYTVQVRQLYNKDLAQDY